MLIAMNRSAVEPNAQAAATHRGMAHFAGTGPDGATCGKCAHHGPIENARTPVCKKARQLGVVSRTRLPGDTAACRHFEVAK